jgi:hypothetical protein
VEKRRAVNAHHSNSPRAHHPSHSCIFLALVVVVAPPCPVVEEVYSLVFLLAQTFTGMGFLTLPSMRVSLPLNQMLALVARGLCDSQVVMIFWNCVLWLHFWFSVVVILRLLDLKDWSCGPCCG